MGNFLDSCIPGASDHEGKTFVVGYAFMSKKIGRMGAVLDGSVSQSIRFEQIDFDEKHIKRRGRWDLILHKLSEDVMNRTTNVESRTKVEFIERYLDLNPQTVVIDSISSIETIVSRKSTSLILESALQFKTVRAPKYFYVEDATELGSSSFCERMRRNGMEFPLICKPVEACGTAASHRLTVILNEEGVADIRYPCIVQEYIDHGGTLMKVYVLGNSISVHARRSLPNLTYQVTDSQPVSSSVLRKSSVSSEKQSQPRSLSFDSQKPYPTSEDFGMEEDKRMAIDDRKTTWPEQDQLNSIAACLRQAFGLSLFGFDLIQSTDKHLYVVDLNYFPSYKELENFPDQLRQYLKDRIEEHLKRS